MSGYVRMRPSITHFTSDGAVFDDGHFEEFDTVVMATGYDYKFPFLDEKVSCAGRLQTLLCASESTLHRISHELDILRKHQPLKQFLKQFKQACTN